MRDYGTGTWEGGDEGCDHKATSGEERKFTNGRGEGVDDDYAGSNLRSWTTRDGTTYGQTCGKCGARRIDGQIGLESSPDEWASRLVDVFREVRRVLRDDGTLWVECGDSYTSGQGGRQSNVGEMPAQALQHEAGIGTGDAGSWQSGATTKLTPGRGTTDLKPKDLIGQPWLLAFALRADGWVLRQCITWSKPNAMPESVTDRCTTAHSYVFMFAKAKRVGPEPSRWEHLPEADKRVLATLIDTEGSICIKRMARESINVQYGAQVVVTNQSLALLETARAMLGGDVGNVQVKDGKNAPVHYWQTSNKVARDLLLAVYPYLIVKQRQARIAIHAESILRLGRTGRTGRGNYRPDKDSELLERLWRANKECNQRGDPDLTWVPEPKYGKWAAGPRYFYDAEALREPQEEPWRSGTREVSTSQMGAADDGRVRQFSVNGREYNPAGKNARSVWTIPTEPNALAICRVCDAFWQGGAPREHCGQPVVQHFAAFPRELVRRMILAGTSERGVCVECGAPWVREVEQNVLHAQATNSGNPQDPHGRRARKVPLAGKYRANHETTGWHPSCRCGNDRAHPSAVYPDDWVSVPATILDPFAGSGTSLLVARQLGRHAIGIELNERYAAMCKARMSQLSLLAQ